MKVITQTKKLYVREFDSLGDFYDYAIYDQSCPEYNNDGHFEMVSRDNDSHFRGTKTWEDAVSLARNGWTEGLSKLNYRLENTDEVIRDIKNKFNTFNSVSGAYVDVSRYIEGEPECMVEFENAVENSFATIYVSGSVNASVETSEIIERGKKVMEVIDALEQNNIRTKVIMIFAANSSRGFFGDTSVTDIQFITIKTHRDRLDLESLNFAICHPSFFRRLLFAVKERASTRWRETMGIVDGGGYGRSCDSIKPFIEDSEPHIVFDSHAGGAYEDINKQVLKMIRREQ